MTSIEQISSQFLPKEILIGADHAGLPLKKIFLDMFTTFPWKDVGTQTDESVDYPDFSDAVASKINHFEMKQLHYEKVSDFKNSSDPKHFKNALMGLLICGSGQGMAIRANKYKHVRAALCWNEESAKLARAHNNANILCLGARMVTPQVAEKILITFLTTPYEGGRHAQRVAKLSQDI
jgi:ribose 5-phosphate isomerase B